MFHGDQFFVDLNGDGKFTSNAELKESFPYGKFTKVAGKWYSIVASPDGSRLEIAAPAGDGNRRSAHRIVGATLSSDEQTLDLKFHAGSAEAVAGTYRVRSVRLQADVDRSDMSASYGEDEPELTIANGQTVRLKAGPPLTVEPQVAVKGGTS